MKKLVLFALILVTVFLGAIQAFAQAKDLAGQWQGTLSAGGNQLRAVFKITKDDKGVYSGNMYSIDQTTQPIPIGSITLKDSTVTIDVPVISGSYQGEMSADGNSIKGTWTQGPGSLPLELDRPAADKAWPIPQ